MHALSIRAVPVNNEPEDDIAWQLQALGGHKGKGQKRSRESSVQQHEAEAGEEFMCTTKWQLYFHEKDTKSEAVGLMRQGMESSIATNLFEPQDTIKLYELEDEATPWRCLRLVFETRRGLVFKRTMRDVVAATGNVKISTNQPKNVSLYALFSDNIIFNGTAADLVAWCVEQADGEQEI
jgi:hypothetical protein